MIHFNDILFGLKSVLNDIYAGVAAAGQGFIN